MIGSVRISQEKQGPADLRAPLRGWRGGTHRGRPHVGKCLEGNRERWRVWVGRPWPPASSGVPQTASFWGPDLPCRPPDSSPGWACPGRGPWGRAHTGSARALSALGSVLTYAGDHPPRVVGRRAASSLSSPPFSRSKIQTNASASGWWLRGPRGCLPTPPRPPGQLFGASVSLPEDTAPTSGGRYEHVRYFCSY